MSVTGSCPVQRCWESFQTTKKSLGIQDVLDNYLHSSVCTTADLRGRLCAALKSVFGCFQNATRLCRGNLGFHSTRAAVERKIEHCNCSFVDNVIVNDDVTHSFSLSMDEPWKEEDTLCIYNGEAVYRLCSLFGDSHLRTFTGIYQTCIITGTWPLLENQHFTVQTTQELTGQLSATTVSKVRFWLTALFLSFFIFLSLLI